MNNIKDEKKFIVFLRGLTCLFAELHRLTHSFNQLMNNKIRKANIISFGINDSILVPYELIEKLSININSNMINSKQNIRTLA